MSPELALVDPELRADAVARLPPIYVNAFLEFPPLTELAPLAVPAVAVPTRTIDVPIMHRPTSRASAALAYLALAVARTFLFEAAVFAAVFALVLVASLIA